jgi:hypothetical protein
MDGIPVALMEAMASGVPVVASRLSGIPELVEDGRTGLLAAPGDATGLANAIWRLQDPLLREALARDGRLRVQQEFDLHKTVRQLADLFEDRQVLNEIAWRRQEEVWAAAAARRTAAAGDQPGSPASDVCSMGWEQREPSQVKAAVPPKAVA